MFVSCRYQSGCSRFGCILLTRVPTTRTARKYTGLTVHYGFHQKSPRKYRMARILMGRITRILSGLYGPRFAETAYLSGPTIAALYGPSRSYTGTCGEVLLSLPVCTDIKFFTRGNYLSLAQILFTFPEKKFPLYGTKILQRNLTPRN